MSEYTTNGHVVTDGESCMGIFSTVSFLNDRIEQIEDLNAQLEAEKKKVETLRKAVEFYANKENWAMDRAIALDSDYTFEVLHNGFEWECGGKHARQALKEIELMEKE
jgi:hypothetical protein